MEVNPSYTNNVFIKMKKKTFLGCALMLIIFLACKKDKDSPPIVESTVYSTDTENIHNGIIEGLVIDAITKLPIEGAEIVEEHGATHVNPGDSEYDSQYFKTLATTKQDGKFSITIDTTLQKFEPSDKTVPYRMYYAKHTGFVNERIYYSDTVEQINYTVELKKSAIVKIIINNITPHDNTDSFELYFRGQSTFKKTGTVVDYKDYHSCSQLKNYKIQWFSTKNGVSNDSIFTIFTGTNDTVQVHVNY